MNTRKVILITGATDGIGLEAARMLAAEGHRLLLHGRNTAKLEAAVRAVGGDAETFQADLAHLDEVAALADAVLGRHTTVDVLVNNAGVFKTPQPTTPSGLDVRFVVNTLAPYLLTRRLLRGIPPHGRVVNVASAAQAPVDVEAMAGRRRLGDTEAYAQSKLALIMWTVWMAGRHPEGPAFIAVNPGSLLGTKMVREGFGIPGGDVRIGAEILCRAARSAEFARASGRYWDNDSGRFAPPHPDAADPAKVARVVRIIEELVAEYLP